MVAFLLVLADGDLNLRILGIGLAAIAIILVGAGIIELVKRWRLRPFHAKMSASEQLARFREQFEKGEIKPEEFERIKSLLSERIRQEMEVGAAPASLPSEDKPAPPSLPDG
jgi:hypothetical protein